MAIRPPCAPVPQAWGAVLVGNNIILCGVVQDELERFAAALRAAKSAVDPAERLNPGVLIDCAGPRARHESCGEQADPE
jgi:hypothetical protein